MNPDTRADLIFDLAEVLNEYSDGGEAPDEVRGVALGFIHGWESE